MSDEVVILRDGKVEQQGDPNGLYEKPATRFVADFLGKSNFLTGTVAGRESDKFTYGVGGETLVQAGEATPAKPDGSILVALRPEKIAVRSDRPDHRNAARGSISEFNYHGATYHFRVQTDGLGDIIATAPAWKCDVTPEIGAEVWLGWEPDAAVVVRDN